MTDEIYRVDLTSETLTWYAVLSELFRSHSPRKGMETRVYSRLLVQPLRSLDRTRPARGWKLSKMTNAVVQSSKL